ncbi:hypothetical protein V502_08802 [Pseudogymnoascus sp. VKM F-4520 (FW-2644)]|nr:hypothetical protein V502_08802 [Pseudogymnoascus sp. VKM F-4520 (FW-2644)]
MQSTSFMNNSGAQSGSSSGGSGHGIQRPSTNHLDGNEDPVFVRPRDQAAETFASFADTRNNWQANFESLIGRSPPGQESPGQDLRPQGSLKNLLEAQRQRRQGQRLEYYAQIQRRQEQRQQHQHQHRQQHRQRQRELQRQQEQQGQEYYAPVRRQRREELRQRRQQQQQRRQQQQQQQQRQQQQLQLVQQLAQQQQ